MKPYSILLLFTVTDDFVRIRETLVFLTGIPEQCFSFHPIPDGCVEHQESIIIQANSADILSMIYIDDNDSMLSCVTRLRVPGSWHVKFLVCSARTLNS